MLEVEGLTLHYGGSRVLHGVDLVAEAGRVTAVMGTNGVGKTSLLKAIAGRHRPSGGTIRLDGAPLTGASAFAAARAGIAYVPQGREVFPLLTVQENLETGFACLPRHERRIPSEVLDLFPVLGEMRARRGGDLSGGQQQQLAIARALVTRPRVLLLDEPTEGIQPSIIAEIGRVIAHLAARGDMAIVLVEQYFAFAWDLAHRVTVMSRGRAESGERAALDREDVLRRVSV